MIYMIRRSRITGRRSIIAQFENQDIGEATKSLVQMRKKLTTSFVYLEKGNRGRMAV
jgi:hypothetical protein